MRDIWFSVLAILFLAGASAGQAQPAAGVAPSGQAAPPAAAADTGNPLAIAPGDRILGNPDAPVTIIEYASLTCPHCRHFETDVLPKMKEKWIDTGKAKLILRDFPLDEPAVRAAMVARCAPASRYYAFVDAFFRNQEQWATARDYRAALERLAQLGGMSRKDFDACVGDKAVEEGVLGSRLTAAQKLGVSATPTFFVNGTKFDGEPTEQRFDQLLSTEAAKS